ncbi:hypothetical protein MHU86_1003 [Fragilaria crotonensis]|nr:hypothetical protein MHU86_1003 [Fragilaria crotonensis]
MEQQPRKDMQSSLERPLVFRNWKKALLAFGAEFLLSEGSLVRYGDGPRPPIADYFLGNVSSSQCYCNHELQPFLMASKGDDDQNDKPPILAMTGLPLAVAGDKEVHES